jgi:hypothetical protein
MSINLTPEQQSVIEQAIQSGLVRSVDEFVVPPRARCRTATADLIRRRLGLPATASGNCAKVSGSI